MGDIVRKENNRTIESTKQDNSRTGWGSNRNNGAITMGLPSVYVAQWENLEQWYDIGRERKRPEIVGTIDKGLGPGVQKHGLECRHVMRAG